MSFDFFNWHSLFKNFFINFESICQVSLSASIRIGSAPTYFMAFTGEIKVRSGTSTMSSFSISSDNSAKCNAAVQNLLLLQVCFYKTREFFFKCFTNGPFVEIQLLLIHSDKYFSKSPYWVLIKEQIILFIEFQHIKIFILIKFKPIVKDCYSIFQPIFSIKFWFPP